MYYISKLKLLLDLLHHAMQLAFTVFYDVSVGRDVLFQELYKSKQVENRLNYVLVNWCKIVFRCFCAIIYQVATSPHAFHDLR